MTLSAVEESRVRLRYDALKEDKPDILTKKPTKWRIADPTNGVTDAVQKEFKDYGIPGGTIALMTRAIWRKCVRDRADLSVEQLQAQREEDLELVRGWVSEQDWGGMAKAKAQAFYGLDRKRDWVREPVEKKPEGWVPKGKASRNTALGEAKPIVSKRKRRSSNDDDNIDGDSGSPPKAVTIPTKTRASTRSKRVKVAA
ncbi:hypothetical protein BKA93DRAFT_796665, partial [Sparassis latifolia]